MAVFVMIVRLRSQKKPINEKKIIIPPIAMSTGALMFIFEEFRVAPIQILEASALGIVFSTLLIATSKFEVRDQDIYMKRSKAFVFILVGLVGKLAVSCYPQSATAGMNSHTRADMSAVRTV